MSIERWSEDIPLPDEVLDIPRLSTISEFQFLSWFMKNKYTGTGHVVELGTWLGASTAAMLHGLSQNEREAVKQRKLHAFDLFMWFEGYSLLLERNPGLSGVHYLPDLPHQASFLPVYHEHLQTWSGMYDTYAGDISQKKWTQGPIEFLAVDVMKSWESTSHVATEFFPHLIPGESYIYHQDYKYHATPWIHPLMYRLRDYLQPAYSVLRGATIVFKCVKPLTREICAAAADFDTLSFGEIDEALEYSWSLVMPDEPIYIGELYGAWFFCHLYQTARLKPGIIKHVVEYTPTRNALQQYLHDLPASVGYGRDEAIRLVSQIVSHRYGNNQLIMANQLPSRILLKSLQARVAKRLKDLFSSS